MKNYLVPMGILIRSERKKKGMTVEDLAQLSNYSRSYISRIENGYTVPDEVYSTILRCFNLDYLSSEKCIVYSEQVNKVIHDLIYLKANVKQIEDLLLTIEEYKYSPLFTQYMILKLLYYVTYDNISSEEKSIFIDEIDTIAELFCAKDQQIIYDYLGFYNMSINHDIANSYFSKALALGSFTHTTSILFYHLGIFHHRTNNPSAALFYNMKAHDKFAIELNHRRLFYVQLHIGNNFSIGKNYEFAQKLYLSLLGNDIIVDADSIIFNNLCWNSYKMKNYNQALEYASKCCKNNYNLQLNFILIYHALGEPEQVSKHIKLCQDLDLSDFQRQMILLLNKQFIDKVFDDEYISLLKQVYTISKSCDDSESMSMLNHFLVAYYEKNRLYKEANLYLKERHIDSLY